MSRTRTVVLTGVLLAAIPALALAAAGTRVHIYRPFDSAGKPLGHVSRTFRGRCLGGADASRREDAWRCEVTAGFGAFILDPCFSSPRARHFVLCPSAGLGRNKVIKIRLSSKLPRVARGRGEPSAHGLPWALLTVRGWKCRLNTGATTTADGRRLNYTCKGTSKDLWGRPRRGSKPWTIYVASQDAKHLHNRIGIRAAWF